MGNQMSLPSSSSEDPLDKEYAELIKKANQVNSGSVDGGSISENLAAFRCRVWWSLGLDPDLG